MDNVVCNEFTKVFSTLSSAEPSDKAWRRWRSAFCEEEIALKACEHMFWRHDKPAPESLPITGRSRFVSSSGTRLSVDHLMEEGMRLELKTSLWRIREEDDAFETMLYHRHGGSFCVCCWAIEGADRPIRAELLSIASKPDFSDLLQLCAEFREDTRAWYLARWRERKSKSSKSSRARSSR